MGDVLKAGENGKRSGKRSPRVNGQLVVEPRDTASRELEPTHTIEGRAGYERDIAWFCFQEDGWLRIVPDPDLLRVHIKWKFTVGRWDNHYCYVVGYVSEIDTLLQVLRRKVEGARAGTHKPSVDRWFRPE